MYNNLYMRLILFLFLYLFHLFLIYVSFGDNFFIELNGISKVKPGNCEHFDINFLLTSEKNSMKLVVSFNCKICHKNNMIELFNTQNKIDSGSITYKCIGCGSGNITAGYLYQNEEIKIDNF